MHAQSAPQPDLPVAVTPSIQPRMPWRVVAVAVLPGWRLHVRFVDGTEGTVDLTALIHSPDAGVFAGLADAGRFGQVSVSLGAVTWPGEIDLAPDAMYAAIKQTGTWVLS
jgi:hypothetical protein